jgi:iron complex outermembrane receptor protein
MFGANTWAVGSNIHDLKPESVTTYELATDWKISKNFDWRANLFYMTFANQIAYSPTLVLVNYYTRTNAGLETELLSNATIGGGELSAYANYSFVRLVKETVLLAGLAPSGLLTWAPEHVAKAGANYKWGPASGFVQGIFQGPVRRRASDLVSALDRSLRDDVVPAFFLLDIGVGYDVLSWLRLTAKITNVADNRAPIVKAGDFPFDYRLEGRRAWGGVEITL